MRYVILLLMLLLSVACSTNQSKTKLCTDCTATDFPGPNNFTETFCAARGNCVNGNQQILQYAAGTRCSSLNTRNCIGTCEGNYECEFQPASIGASGYYRADFNATCEYGDSKNVIFTVYVNGSPTSLSAIMPFSNLDPSKGTSISISGLTTQVIDNTDTIEVYVESDESSGTLTFVSCGFSITRVGNA